MLAAALILILFLVIAAVIALGLRRMVMTEAATEQHLESPQMHVLRYAVPPGQDPAVPSAALHEAGYVAVGELVEGREVLLVECPEADRQRVRDIIERTTATSFAGGQLKVGPVSFDDER